MRNVVIPVCIESGRTVIVTGESNNYYCSMAIDTRQLELSRIDLLTQTYEMILFAIGREDPSIISIEHLNWLSTSESWLQRIAS